MTKVNYNSKLRLINKIMAILETLTSLQKIDEALKDDRFKEYHRLLNEASLFLNKLDDPECYKNVSDNGQGGIIIRLVSPPRRDVLIEFQEITFSSGHRKCVDLIYLDFGKSVGACTNTFSTP